jgi:tetratricopeptide (TPR) repeat protein
VRSALSDIRMDNKPAAGAQLSLSVRREWSPGMNGSPDFIDLRSRAEFLELCGDAEGARELQDFSLQIAREIDLVCYSYQLMWRDRVDDAIEMLLYTISQHSDSWNVHHSLAEAYEQKGDFARAIEWYRHAHERTAHEQQRAQIERRLNELTDLAAAC